MINILKRDKHIEESKLLKLAKKHNTTVEVIKLLLNRGYKENELSNYIQTEEYYIAPFNSISYCDEAATIIKTYLNDDNAEIYVYGDYDCDGVMSTTIMNGILTAIKESINSKVNITIKTPNRIDGYGLSMDWCINTFPDIKYDKNILVITVDNGITKKDEVRYLQNKGIECIITDHHAPKTNEVPNCLVVDPWLNDKDNKNSLGLCGAAIAFKICGRLLELYEDDSNYILNYLANAAIATITDMMPATQENIGLVKYGLWLIDNGYTSEAINYYHHYVNKDITVKDIAFEIGPQINACGRMGNIELATKFMNTTDEDELIDIYNSMLELNDNRKELEKKIVSEIMEQDFSKDLVIIAYIPELGGVGGTVASKLVEAYNKPVILLGGKEDILHGSARTAMNINLHTLFSYEVEKGNMINFGGHEASAGVTVNINKIDDLRKDINIVIASLLTAYETINEVSDKEEIDNDTNIEVDDIISLKDINKNTIIPYSDLLCFADLKDPIFAIKDLEVIEARSSSNNPNHLCLNLVDNSITATKNKYGKLIGKEIWAWNKMNEYKDIGEPKKIHLIGKLEPDFRNPKFYTFNIQTIIPA